MDLKYDRKRWGIIFLLVDSYLREKDRISLIVNAIEMYYGNEEERSVRRRNYAGRLWTRGDKCVLGHFYGQCFAAELDVRINDRRIKKSKVAFLVTEEIRAGLN